MPDEKNEYPKPDPPLFGVTEWDMLLSEDGFVHVCKFCRLEGCGDRPTCWRIVGSDD